MERVSVTICGKLGEAVEVAKLKESLDGLFSGIHCSIPHPCNVRVYRKENCPGREDCAACGQHIFSLYPDSSVEWTQTDSDKLQSLLITLPTMMHKYLQEYPPLGLVCAFTREEGEPRADAALRAEGAESPQIADPEENDFVSEWRVEKPKYSLKQWIVSDKVRGQFQDAVNIMRFREKIYEEWGFGEVDPNPRAIVCFYGPPGTGKTMAAHVMAAELGKPILCADYAQVESKYLGESPKRLAGAFQAASKNDAVLFFDEADSFLGKRIENVQQSSDQATNSLRSSMLILLENFKGVVVFATNLVTNFDKAFESRVLAFIEVELPTQEARFEIIKSMLPAKMPLEEGFGDDAVRKLAEASEGFSGRHIRSSMQLGLVKAATHSMQRGKDEVRKEELLAAFRQIRETMDDLARKRNAGGAPGDGDGEINLTDAEKVSLAELAQKKISVE